MLYNSYNVQAELARKHYEDMERKYPKEIVECIRKTRTYGGELYNAEVEHKRIEADHKKLGKIEEVSPILQQNTTDGMLFNLPQTAQTKIALLNFASYKSAGGGFINGAKAQEECLCHSSILYNVLVRKHEYYEWNQRNINHGLYTDRALYTSGVIFEDPKGKAYKCDVITCAAPNRSICQTSNYFAATQPVTEEQNDIVLKNRISFIADICMKENVDTVILGAWGCGVFSQDPHKVAKYFYETFKETGIACIYAIPDEKTYKAFEDTFEELMNGRIYKNLDNETLER